MLASDEKSPTSENVALKVDGISDAEAFEWTTQSVNELSTSTTCISESPFAIALTRVCRALFGYRLCIKPLTLFLQSSSEAKSQYCVSG